jgi:hypothetical protein
LSLSDADVYEFVPSRGREKGYTVPSFFPARDFCVSWLHILHLSAPVVMSFSLSRAQCVYNFFVLLTWVQLASTDGRTDGIMN